MVRRLADGSTNSFHDLRQLVVRRADDDLNQPIPLLRPADDRAGS